MARRKDWMEDMPELQRVVMAALYGHDVWEGFEARPGDTMQGWNGDHPSLANLAAVGGDKIVVDVGVWKGQSTINLARSIKDCGIDGVVIAVDTFLGSPEHWSGNDYFGRVHGQPDLFQIFLSNVKNAGVSDYVVPMPQTSSTAAHILRDKAIRPALIHVDAAHEYREVMIDLEDYWGILQDGGYMIGDDYHESWPGVVQAAGEFSARVRRPLSIVPPKFILRK